jgi:hypothetical protein
VPGGGLLVAALDALVLGYDGLGADLARGGVAGGLSALALAWLARRWRGGGRP